MGEVIKADYGLNFAEKNTYKLQLEKQNLYRVFNSRSGCMQA
jgi:hypothetical protein